MRVPYSLSPPPPLSLSRAQCLAPADPHAITTLESNPAGVVVGELSRDSLTNLRHRSDKGIFELMISAVVRNGAATRSGFTGQGVYHAPHKKRPGLSSGTCEHGINAVAVAKPGGRARGVEVTKVRIGALSDEAELVGMLRHCLARTSLADVSSRSEWKADVSDGNVKVMHGPRVRGHGFAERTVPAS